MTGRAEPFTPDTIKVKAVDDGEWAWFCPSCRRWGPTEIDRPDAIEGAMNHRCPT